MPVPEDATMHIAILEPGRINAAIADQFARYPEMFRTMFERAGATDLEGGAQDGGDGAQD